MSLNRLSRESSPYLLQHQNNPVDWYPWGEEALSRARRENKPILLSVGYSSCHWCHVMAHESFENEEIARLMNERFINIKVDREERPDLDQIYQNVAQAITRGGGWPLTVFLTPDLRPFFGGTYYPPEDRWGRPGFPRVLQALSDAFHNDYAGISENAGKLTEFIRGMDASENASAELPTQKALVAVAEDLASTVDWADGGFGGAPKFPNSMSLDFLWREGLVAGLENAREGALLTLRKMARGGIYDQLGGGFHRYSVDEKWSVPHFEKMLYDNALLLRSYSQVLLRGELDPPTRALFTDVVRETVEYLLREMRAPEGAFYAAQDADTEEGEGEYFVWDPASLKLALTEPEAMLAAAFYGVTLEGNFEHGKTVLYRARSLDEAAALAGISSSEALGALASARKKMIDARSRRLAPGTDTKILASWNGLAISGLAWASRAFDAAGENEASMRAFQAAARAFEFIRTALGGEEGRLFSVYSGGAAKLNAYLDDYAFMAQAAIDLARFESRSEKSAEYLANAESWARTVLKNFSDSASPGYFFTSDDHEQLIHRPKSTHDQAIPSGTAVMIGVLIALSEIDSEKGREFVNEAIRQLQGLFPAAARRAYGQGELLNAALLYERGPIVVTGEAAVGDSRVFKSGAPAKPGETLVCCRGTCSLPLRSEQDVSAAIAGLLAISS
ncbi:MAG: thioredoxin domain-containing protein [Oligoflexia bacterium]|nr:thioredoxin domain-containing protein [Oligoflexia bacterium]